MLAWINARLSETSTRILLSTLVGNIGGQLQLTGKIDWATTTAHALIALSVAITPDSTPNPPPAGP